jgi:hypothetical protein
LDWLGEILSNQINLSKLSKFPKMKFINLLLVVLLCVALINADSSETMSEDELDHPTEVYSTDVDPQTLGVADTLKCQQIYGQYCGPGYCAGKWWGTCPDGNHQQPLVAGCSTSSTPKDPLDGCCQTHDA